MELILEEGNKQLYIIQKPKLSKNMQFYDHLYCVVKHTRDYGEMYK